MDSIPPDFDEKYNAATKKLRECRKKYLNAKKTKIRAISSAKGTRNPKIKEIKIKAAGEATKEFEKIESEFKEALEEKNQLSKIKTIKRKLINEPVHYEKFGKPDDINTTWNVFYTTMQYLHRGEVDKNCRLVCRWWNDLVLKGTNQLPLRTIEKLCYGFSQTNPYKNNSRWGYQYCIGLLRDPLTPKIRNNGLKSCVFRNFHAYLADDKFYKKLENFVKDYGKKIKVEEVKFVLPEQGKEIIETRLEEIRQIWDKFLVGDRLQLVLGEPSEDAMEDMVDARSFSYLLTKPALVNMPVPHPKIEIICNDEQYHGEYDLYEYNENVMMKFLSGIHFPEGLKVALTLKHHTWNRNFGAALARLFLEHDNPEKMVCPIITKEYVGYEHVWLTLQYFRSRNLPHRSKRSSTITTYEAERKDGWVFVMDYYSKRYPQNTEFLKFSFRSPRKDVDGSEGDSGALNQRLRGLLDQNQIIELD